MGQANYNNAINQGYEAYVFESSLLPLSALPSSVTSNLGVDNHIVEKAQSFSIPINSLDEVSDQVAVATFGDQDTTTNQIKRLQKAIDNFEDDKEKVLHTITSYENSDETAFENIAKQAKTEAMSLIINSENFYDLVVDIRNTKWTKIIKDLLEADGNNQYFIAAGSLHWFGEDSVIKKLKVALPGVQIEKVAL